MARKKTNKARKGKGRTGLIIFALGLMLILLAVFGGYALARYIRGESGQKDPKQIVDPEGAGNGSADADGKNAGNNGSGGNGGNNGSTGNNPDGYGTNTGNNGRADTTRDGGYERPSGSDNTAVLTKTPTEIIFDVDPETRQIDQMLVVILRSGEGKLDIIRIDTDVSYTMSAGLYTALTPDNTVLPQTVTFSRLYKYYDNDKAFDAGRRIAAEMLSIDIIYYTAMKDDDFDRIFRITKYSDGTITNFSESLDTMKGEYGTGGSMKGFLEVHFSGAVTSWSTEQKLRYLDTWDLLDERDVTFIDAPVIERNESAALDTDAVGKILYDILY